MRWCRDAGIDAWAVLPFVARSLALGAVIRNGGAGSLTLGVATPPNEGAGELARQVMLSNIGVAGGGDTERVWAAWPLLAV